MADIVEMFHNSVMESLPFTNQSLRMQAHLGLPKHMVSDNRPQFTLEAFRKFTTANGVKHVMGAAYEPCNQWSCGKIGAEFQERSNS